MGWGGPVEGEGEAEDVGNWVDEGEGGVLLIVQELDAAVLAFQVDEPAHLLLFACVGRNLPGSADCFISSTQSTSQRGYLSADSAAAASPKRTPKCRSRLISLYPPLRRQHSQHLRHLPLDLVVLVGEFAEEQGGDSTKRWVGTRVHSLVSLRLVMILVRSGRARERKMSSWRTGLLEMWLGGVSGTS